MIAKNSGGAIVMVIGIIILLVGQFGLDFVGLTMTPLATRVTRYRGYDIYKDTETYSDTVWMAEGSPRVSGLWRTKAAVKRQIDKKLDPAPIPVPDPIPDPTPDPIPDSDDLPVIPPDPVPDPTPDPVPDPGPEPTPIPEPAPGPAPDNGDEPIQTTNIVQIIFGATLAVIGFFMQFGAGLEKNIGAIAGGRF